jgi:hypothetical protein
MSASPSLSHRTQEYFKNKETVHSHVTIRRYTLYEENEDKWMIWSKSSKLPKLNKLHEAHMITEGPLVRLKVTISASRVMCLLLIK